MSDTDPDVETVTEQILLSDRFAELVEEMASHYHDSDYKDKLLPELEATFAEEARDAGLSDDEAQTVADRVKGQLMGRAQEQVPPAPAERLPPGDGPIPEARYEELPGPLVRLLRLIETEEEPFRKAHRLIDAVEWAVKWHTTLALSDLLSETGLPAEVKVLLAHGLRTPSLGLWNKFFRKSLDALEDPSLPWRSWERLTTLEEKHKLVNFRNEYAHGATPPPEECREAVETYLPVLKEMVHTPIFTDVGLAIRGEGAGPKLLRGSEREALGIEIEEGHATALLPDLDLNGEAPGKTSWTERSQLDLWPLGLTATASMEHSRDADGDGEERPQFFYFNALKNEAVERLNYEEALLDRAPGLYAPFHERLPLRQWKKAEGPDLERFRARIETLTEDFVGRREERERLRTFAAEGEGTLMVFGAPGIGKSALLAQVKREIEAGVDLDGQDLSDEMPPVIEYFIRSGESDDVTEFLRHLCRRLDRRYGLSGHGLGSEPVELNDQLRARLQAIEDQAREDGESPERTLLLVDGLDEGPELGRYIPESRPWLPVLVSSRETEEARSFYENREIQARQEMTVGPLSAADVRALLYKVVSKYDPGLTEDYVQAVAERSEGNPLYLQLLAEQLFQGELEVGNIDALPDKVGELYEETVQRVTEGGENRMAEDTLLLLAEAQAPLSAGAMAGLLDERGSRVRSGLRAAMELLQRQDGGPEAPDRYQLFHETLREWLRDPDGAHVSDCDEMNEQVAERCFQWTERREDGARGYALRHAAAHLKAAGRDEALYELLTDEGYQDAQVRATGQFDATYRAYEAGLEAYVERNGGTPENDVRLCRLALDAGQTAREAKEGVTQAFRWAEAGRMEDALQRTEVLGEEKYFLAALRLLWIEADRQAEKPEEERSKEKAEKVLDTVEERIAPGTEAIDWSEFIEEDFMAWWTGRVLRVLPDVDISGVLGRTSEPGELAESLIGEIQDADGLTGAFSQTAIRQAQALPSDWKLCEVLSDLISALARDGSFGQTQPLFEQVLESARSIDDEFARAEALSKVSSALAEAGSFEQAFDAAQSIDSNSDRADALSEVASALTQAGQPKQAEIAFNQALDIARSIDRGFGRSNALSKVALALAETGSCEQAFDAAQSIDSNSDRANALSEVASALTQAGRSEQAEVAFNQALDTARSIDRGFDRSNALSKVALTLVEAGQSDQAENVFEQALDAARSINRGSDRADALSEVASALTQAGQSEQAEIAFDQALNTARSVDPDAGMVGVNRRAKALSEVAPALAQASAFDQALDAARSIDDDHRRANTLSEVTSALVEVNALNKALSAARSIDSGYTRSDTLSEVTSALAEAGALNKALDAARSINWGSDRAEALSGVVRVLVEARPERAENAFEQILIAVRSIDDSGHSEALSKVASAFAETSQSEQEEDALGQALDAARLIDNDSDCAEVLREVAPALARANSFDQTRLLFEKALDAAQSVDWGSTRTEALSEMASALAETYSFNQARPLFKKILNVDR